MWQSTQTSHCHRNARFDENVIGTQTRFIIAHGAYCVYVKITLYALLIVLFDVME